MNTRHAEIRVWSAYKEELTSWLCLLDDRFAEELDESEQSAVPVQQSTLDVGKAARSSKLWFLLRQSLSKFQRAFGRWQGCAVQQALVPASSEFEQVSESTRPHPPDRGCSERCECWIRVLALA
eukprot:s11587_g1.t1